MRVFKLPDLGEGLPDAEIIKWLVAEGDQVELDQPMVTMETAKAVVEVPAPFSGRILTLHGQAGDIIDTGMPLVSFDGEDATASSGKAAAGLPPAKVAKADNEQTEDGSGGVASPDTGTVVGKVESSDRVVSEPLSLAGKVKVTPATRALAKKLKIDLSQVTGSGKDGVITVKDVKQAAATEQAAQPAEDAAASQTADKEAAPQPAEQAAEPVKESTAPHSADKKAAPPASDDAWSALRGTRRSMARAMSESHAQVVPTSLCEDADLALWEGRQDLTVRLLRGLVAGVRREPSLNAWFDPDGPRRLIHPQVHAGIAVDTQDGLFAVRLPDIDSRSPAEIRESLDLIREQVANRSVPPEDLSGYTIMLSNVGVYAGRYATPIVAPPCVAILASGRMRDQVTAAHGGIAVHPVIPLSLTFDHRAVTGGEAARFLAACIEDLALPF